MAGCRSRALPHGEATEARREFERSAGGQALLGDPAHLGPPSHAHPELALAGERRERPRFPPALLPLHLLASRGSRFWPPPAQRGAPTVKRRAEGLLKRGQSGRRG
nr:uncharacterized protein LOC123575564 [Macaca fascicularis]